MSTTIHEIADSGMTDAARERRLRRQAKQHGMVLRKSRRRNDPNLDDHGGWMIVDVHTGGIVGGARFDWELEDIEAFLSHVTPTSAFGA